MLGCIDFQFLLIVHTVPALYIGTLNRNWDYRPKDSKHQPSIT